MKSRSGFAKIMKDAKNVAVIMGAGTLQRKDGAAIQSLAMSLAKKFDASFNMLHLRGGRVGALHLGFTKTAKPLNINSKSFVFLLGADSHYYSAQIDKKAFVVYQGHHGDIGAHRADVILPGCAYTEKDGLYMNTEGRLQLARKAVSTVGEAQEDWKILTLLATHLGHEMGYKTIYDVRNSMDNLPELGECITPEFKVEKSSDKLAAAKYTLPLENFYQTCPITRASDTMASCVSSFTNKTKRIAA